MLTGEKWDNAGKLDVERTIVGMNFQQILGRQKADGRLVTEKETHPRVHREKG